MEQQEAAGRNKGGRPKKAVKRNLLLAFKCTPTERQLIEVKAKNAERSVSEYVRETVLNRQTGSRKMILPKDVLLFKADLGHAGGNLNQLAKYCNSHPVLEPSKVTEIETLIAQIKALIQRITNHFQ